MVKKIVIRKGEQIEHIITEDRIREVVDWLLGVYHHGDTDWSYAADKFIQWMVAHDFELQSFVDLVCYLYVECDRKPLEDKMYLSSEYELPFYGYGDDFESFAEDWVNPLEQDSYLKFAYQFT